MLSALFAPRGEEQQQVAACLHGFGFRLQGMLGRVFAGGHISPNRPLRLGRCLRWRPGKNYKSESRKPTTFGFVTTGETWGTWGSHIRIYWSLVFPLGMFTVATIMFENATGLTVLHLIPRTTIWFSLAAWGVTFVGMVRVFERLREVGVDADKSAYHYQPEIPASFGPSGSSRLLGVVSEDARSLSARLAVLAGCSLTYCIPIRASISL